VKKPVTVYTQHRSGARIFAQGFTEPRGRCWPDTIGRNAWCVFGVVYPYRDETYESGCRPATLRPFTVSDAIRWVALGVLPDEEG
jgi:hypothetical protein